MLMCMNEHILLGISNVEKVFGILYEIEMQKTNKTEFRIENVIKKNDIKHFTSNGMAMITHSIAELI